MFAAAGMLLATSCVNEKLDVEQSASEAQVTFSLGLEGNIATRAISDGTSADKLVYAVYKLDATSNEPVLQYVTGSDANGQFIKTDFRSGDNVSVTLAKGQTYQVAFWAQDGDCNAYDTDDLTAVSVDYTANDGLNNAEVRDAFFKTVEFEVAGDKVIEIVLKRPFAQINVGVTMEDWNDAVASGIEINESGVVIDNAANTINLLTGAVTGNETVTYGFNTIPAETLYVETDAALEGKEAYKWLSMSYILVADESVDGAGKATLQDLQYSFSPVSGNDIEFQEGLAGAPVQRNWRTNILGNILTGDIQLNITVDPVYDNDYIYPDTIDQELEMAAKFGGTVTLTQDVVLTSALNVVADMVINMGDYTISNPGDYVIENTANLTINAENGGISGLGAIRSRGGKVTITGGVYTASSDWNKGTFQHILKAENTEVVINSGIFDATIGGVTNAMINVSENAVVTINGGTFKNVNGVIPQFAPYLFTYEKNGKLIINGGDFYGGWRFNGLTATTDIYGGNFTVSYDGQSFNASSTHVLTIYGGQFNLDNGGKLNPSNYVADGFSVVEKDGRWYVGTSVDNPTDLQTALSGTLENTTLLLTDADYGTVTLGDMKDVVLVGSEETTMIFKTGPDTQIENLTLQEFIFEYTGATTDFAVVINASAQIDNLVLENCTFTGTGAKSGRGLYGANSNATIVIRNCTFKDLGYPIYTMSAGGYESLVVENCTFDNIKSWAIMPQYGEFLGDLTVTGCTFVNCLGGGLVKSGNLTAGHTFTFTDNTVTDCTIAGDHNWFSVNASAGTAVVSGNIKDGVEWTPGVADGLK